MCLQAGPIISPLLPAHAGWQQRVGAGERSQPLGSLWVQEGAVTLAGPWGCEVRVVKWLLVPPAWLPGFGGP